MASQGVAGSAGYGTVTIGTGTAPALQIVNGSPLRKSILIQNNHASNDLYIGSDTAVLTTTGVKVIAGGSIEINDYNGPIYAVASAASTDVRYFESGA